MLGRGQHAAVALLMRPLEGPQSRRTSLCSTPRLDLHVQSCASRIVECDDSSLCPRPTRPSTERCSFHFFQEGSNLRLDFRWIGGISEKLDRGCRARFSLTQAVYVQHSDNTLAKLEQVDRPLPAHPVFTEPFLPCQPQRVAASTGAEAESDAITCLIVSMQISQNSVMVTKPLCESPHKRKPSGLEAVQIDWKSRMLEANPLVHRATFRRLHKSDSKVNSIRLAKHAGRGQPCTCSPASSIWAYLMLCSDDCSFGAKNFFRNG